MEGHTTAPGDALPAQENWSAQEWLHVSQGFLDRALSYLDWASLALTLVQQSDQASSTSGATLSTPGGRRTAKRNGGVGSPVQLPASRK